MWQGSEVGSLHLFRVFRQEGSLPQVGQDQRRPHNGGTAQLQGSGKAWLSDRSRHGSDGADLQGPLAMNDTWNMPHH